jgi:penicillin amidase
MPKRLNPARGFVATANEMNLPDTWNWREWPVGFEWAEHSRTSRIHEVLRAQPRHRLEDSLALQTDVLSIPARRLVDLLHAVAAEGDGAVGRDLLLRWDRRLAADSAAAALHEVWWAKHLRPALLDRIAEGDAAVRAALVPGDTETLLSLLERPDERLADRDTLLAQTLAAAVADCRTRLGDPQGWAWGRLHQGHFVHPLGATPEVGPLPKGGSGSCVMNAAYRLDDFRVITGASFRMVVDVGEWDNSRCINAPGQAGDPASAHYADLAPLWAAGKYVPMLFSPAAVDAAAEHIIRLLPG